jgi:hypothetical protein
LPLVTHVEPIATSELPVEISDLVIVGGVLAAEVFLTKDETALFTDHRIVASEILKPVRLGGTLATLASFNKVDTVGSRAERKYPISWAAA